MTEALNQFVADTFAEVAAIQEVHIKGGSGRYQQIPMHAADVYGYSVEWWCDEMLGPLGVAFQLTFRVTKSGQTYQRTTGHGPGHVESEWAEVQEGNEP